MSFWPTPAALTWTLSPIVSFSRVSSPKSMTTWWPPPGMYPTLPTMVPHSPFASPSTTLTLFPTQDRFLKAPFSRASPTPSAEAPGSTFSPIAQPKHGSPTFTL